MKFVLTFLWISAFWVTAHSQSLVWPTPNRAFLEGKSIESYIQSTSSGESESGLFGCVRNDGDRFHEALDLAPVMKRKNGEPTDPVFAAYTGTVVHINSVVGKSSYGRYIVIEHESIHPRIYTLYAHLSKIEPDIKIGSKVKSGQVIGIMGRSAGGYSIPKDRAHLHFEIGLRLSDQFQRWYDRQKFGSENDHGNYNGMNLVGWNALDFYKINRDVGVISPFEYLNQLEPGFVVRVKRKQTPSFVKRYPELVIPGVASSERVGWEIRVTAWGLPLTFKAIGETLINPSAAEGSCQLVSVNPSKLSDYSCREMIRKVGDTYVIGSGGEDLIEILFAD